jgi:DNA (cytosine-5)-methyltransferase 1
MAGFRSLFFNEIDATAAATFRLNFPDAVPFVCPVQELTTSRIIETAPEAADGIDVMMGGPPCQGFSINAPIRSEADSRNHLFRHYIRLVLEGLRPKFVVMENVPGLLSLDRGGTLRDVVMAFELAGYRVAYKILNAAHYGVPQERWRLVILGTRLPGVTPSLPEPRHYSTKRTNFTGGRSCTFTHAIGVPEPGLFGPDASLLPPVTVSEAIGDLPEIPSGGGEAETAYLSPPLSDYQRRARDSERLFNHESANLAKVNQQRIAYVRPGESWRDIPHALLPKGMQRARKSDHTRRYGRLHPDEVSGTILTKCDPHWGTFIHYAQDRIISVREAARIQSFPDSFRFTGSKTEMYRQVGNAVPPLLAQAIARHILEMLAAAGQGHSAA